MEPTGLRTGEVQDTTTPGSEVLPINRQGGYIHTSIITLRRDIRIIYVSSVTYANVGIGYILRNRFHRCDIVIFCNPHRVVDSHQSLFQHTKSVSVESSHLTVKALTVQYNSLGSLHVFFGDLDSSQEKLWILRRVRKNNLENFGLQNEDAWFRSLYNDEVHDL